MYLFIVWLRGFAFPFYHRAVSTVELFPSYLVLGFNIFIVVLLIGNSLAFFVDLMFYAITIIDGCLLVWGLVLSFVVLGYLA